MSAERPTLPRRARLRVRARRRCPWRADRTFGLSVFLRDDERVFRTYFTDRRGVDRLRIDFNLLDLTARGRQEAWEDSPDGWPQSPPYHWWRLHDEYDDDGSAQVVGAGRR